MPRGHFAPNSAIAKATKFCYRKSHLRLDMVHALKIELDEVDESFSPSMDDDDIESLDEEDEGKEFERARAQQTFLQLFCK
jgi:hypothetical protein